MRTLSTEQKELLANHIAKKPIEYIEFYNELYDHYASAYESGEMSFENTITELDRHFHQDKIEQINRYVISKTKKVIRTIYWSELKNFWRWPQIISTLGILILSAVYIQLMPMDIVIFFGFFPLLLFISFISIKGYLLGKRKRIGNKKFKSAHHKATEYFQQLPLHVYNMTVFFPLIVLGPSSQKIHFYEKYPVIVFLLLALFISCAYIGLKIYRNKVKVQYI